MNKIIFSGLMILVCCLFSEVGIVDGKTDISGQCVEMEIPAGQATKMDDVCRAAGHGHCLEASGATLYTCENDNCTGAGSFVGTAIANCNGGVIKMDDKKSVMVTKLVCDVRGWGILTPPKNVPDDFRGAVINATNWLLGFISMLAVLMIIWGGINYLTAAGDEDKARTAKRIITYGLMGVVIAGLAYAMVTVIVTVILK